LLTRRRSGFFKKRVSIENPSGITKFIFASSRPGDLALKHLSSVSHTMPEKAAFVCFEK
jgi:hypothetical protein